jgi:ribosomal subunit interface protein
VHLDIQPRNYKLTARVRETIEDKSQKLLKYADVDRVRYTLSEENLDLVCEVHLHVMGKDFHAKASSEDMLNSVDQASAALEKQLRRYKSKREDRRKAPDASGMNSANALEATLASEAANEPDEDDVER